MKRKENGPLLYRVMLHIFRPLFLAVYRPKIVHADAIPAQGAAVIAGNHIHALDPILVDVCTGRTVHALAKKELHDGPFGWMFRAVGTIPVDLEAKRNHAALEEALEYLRQGCLVNVSPEAKRNYTDTPVLPFKPGAAVMAQRTHCTLIPYAVTGEYKPFRKGLKIEFGDPVHVEGRNVDEAVRTLYEAVYELRTKDGYHE